MSKSSIFIYGFILLWTFILFLLWHIRLRINISDFQYDEIFNVPEAQLIVRYDDIGKMGFGWTEIFDLFSERRK